MIVTAVTHPRLALMGAARSTSVTRILPELPHHHSPVAHIAERAAVIREHWLVLAQGLALTGDAVTMGWDWRRP